MTHKYNQFACPNPACFCYSQFAQGNITHYAWSGKANHIERLRCKKCFRTFSCRKNGEVAIFTTEDDALMIRDEQVFRNIQSRIEAGKMKNTAYYEIPGKHSASWLHDPLGRRSVDHFLHRAHLGASLL